MLPDEHLIARAKLLVPHHAVPVEEHTVSAARILNPNRRVVEDQASMKPRNIGIIENYRAFRITPQRDTLGTYRVPCALEEALGGNKHRVAIHLVLPLATRTRRV